MTYLLDNASSIGLLLFVGIFSIVVWTVLKPRAKQELESHKLIPLSED